MPRALVVVDVQNDFCEGGALAVVGGAAVARAVSTYLGEHGDEYALVVATADWHEPLPDTNDGHFAADGAPDYLTTWPEHCVRDSNGAAYHPDLRLPESTVHVRKGQGRQDYSGFEGRVLGAAGPAADLAGPADLVDQVDLAGVLRAHGVDQVDVVGLATDHCVTATALDARNAGFTVRVLTDLTAGVSAATCVVALTRLAGAQVELATS